MLALARRLRKQERFQSWKLLVPVLVGVRIKLEDLLCYEIPYFLWVSLVKREFRALDQLDLTFVQLYAVVLLVGLLARRRFNKLARTDLFSPSPIRIWIRQIELSRRLLGKGKRLRQRGDFHVLDSVR